MSKRFIIWGMAVLLVAAFVVTASADVPKHNGEAERLVDVLSARPPIPAGEAITLNQQTKKVGSYAHVADAGCQTLSNTCDDGTGALGAYIWSLPHPSNSRIALAEGFNAAPGFSATPCTVKTVSVYIYDWLNFDPANATQVDISIYDDAGGLPGTALATISPDSATVQGNIDVGAMTTVDFSSFNIVIPANARFHVVCSAPNGVPGVSGYYVLSDAGTDDAANCAAGAANTKGSVFYTSVGVWESHATHFGGFQFGSIIFADVCCEAPPPDCFTLSNTCDDGTGALGAYIWSLPHPSNSRIALAEGFDLDPTASRECTVKTVSVYIYDWLNFDPANATQVDISIYDDAGGLPGTALATISPDSATVQGNIDIGAMTTVDFSSFNITAPPGGRLHVVCSAPNGVPGVSGYYVLSDAGTDDAANCAVGAANTKGSVFYTSVGAWESHATHFGGFQFGTIIFMDVCCPPLLFSLCNPASDVDWQAQGNGNARTNYSSASLSSLCGINQAWSYDYPGTILQLQPVVADGKVLVAGTDNLRCLDQASGVQLWSIGSFPYIVGNLRGAPTVDVANGRAYFGGSGAQSFTCVDLNTGAVIWSRNLGGSDGPPLNPGQTSWTPSVLIGGVIYFTQETGWLYALDAATGVDVYAPVAVPGSPAAVPLNALTSDGTKLWVGTANSLGTAGALHQFDAATGALDWSLVNPGMIFYPGNTDFYDPEGFPGSLAYEDGVLYYHSQIRNDGNGFAHFPQTGSVGAIDVALEDGSGAGLLWVNDANAQTLASPGTALGTTGYSGPAIGPGFLYLTSRGFFGGTTEQDGVSAWNKSLGTRIWYKGYTNLGVAGGVPVLDDVRGESPASVFCQPDGTPYLFVGNFGGVWRLMNGNTGAILWERNFSSRVLGTALADDYVVVIVRAGSAAGGGSVVAFNIGADRPRLQLDTQYVFRTATPGDGATADNIVDALRNTGCVDLNISGYSAINPPVVRVSSVHPSLTSSAQRSTAKLSGYDAFLNPPSAKQMKIDILGGVDEGEEGAMVRSFANNATGAADPLFLTVTEGPSAVAPGATQSIGVIYDETGLTNNTGYTNYIEISNDDPDYYPQDPSGAFLGLPTIQFQLFIGCPDAEAVMTTGLGDVWVNNFGADAGGGNFNDPGPQNFNINGNTANMFDGGLALVVQDSLHWAFDGCSVGGYPRRAGEWGPTLPCGLTINAVNVDSPLGAGADAIEETSWNMLDLASTNGYFPASSRCAGGVFVTSQRVASQDPAFGDFVLTAINIQNEPGDFGDISGSLNDLYYGGVTDWDISGTDNLKAFPDGYGQTDGAGAGWGAGSWICGHARLDANIVGAGPLGSGGSPTFMAGDIFNDQGHGDAAFRMFSSPATYGASVDPASTNNTDLAALWSFLYVPSLADGESVTMYYAIYQVENGVNGLPWTNAAEADAAYKEVVCRAKAFAGFGKGDVNCDGCVDLADVVLLGNILDGLYDPTGTGGVYTADADGDNAWTQADYDLVYDVVAGVQPASALANAWRF